MTWYEIVHGRSEQAIRDLETRLTVINEKLKVKKDPTERAILETQITELKDTISLIVWINDIDSAL